MIEQEIRSREPQSKMLMAALNAMQDKNVNLEKNLSAETRVKLDLFSALGEAKRQIEIKNCKFFSELKISNSYKLLPLHSTSVFKTRGSARVESQNRRALGGLAF